MAGSAGLGTLDAAGPGDSLSDASGCPARCLSPLPADSPRPLVPLNPCSGPFGLSKLLSQVAFNFTVFSSSDGSAGSLAAVADAGTQCWLQQPGESTSAANWQSCTSPATYSSLVQGTYTWARAVGPGCASAGWNPGTRGRLPAAGAWTGQAHGFPSPKPPTPRLLLAAGFTPSPWRSRRCR